MKKIFTYIVFTMIILALWHYNKTNNIVKNMLDNHQSHDDKNQEEINIYSSRKEVLIKDVLEAFTKETGIKVNYIIDDANKLISRIKHEGENTNADVLLVADVINLLRAEEYNILQKIDYSKINTQDIVKNIQSDYWIGLTERVRCIVYNKDKIQKDEIKNYEDLADEVWKEKILITSSNVTYNQSLLASIIAANGEEKSREWVKGLVSNMARKPKGGETEQIKSVSSGIGDVAIVNSYYVARLFSENPELKNKIGVIFPNQENRGSMVNISGVGIIKNTKKINNVNKFINFMLSEKAQKMYSYNNHEFVVNKKVSNSDIVSAFGDFKTDEIDLVELKKYTKIATKISDDEGWE